MITWFNLFLIHAAYIKLNQSWNRLEAFALQVPDLATMFKNLDFDDVWSEGKMSDVILYLRGNKSLQIPDSWRPLLPQTIPY